MPVPFGMAGHLKVPQACSRSAYERRLREHLIWEARTPCFEVESWRAIVNGWHEVAPVLYTSAVTAYVWWRVAN